MLQFCDDNVIKKISMRTRFAFLSALFLLFVGQVVFAQVTGTVEDTDGFPLADAEVKIRGSQTTAFTDADGAFSIDAQIGDVLVITDTFGTSKDFNVTSENLGVLSFAAVELEVVTINRSEEHTSELQSRENLV